MELTMKDLEKTFKEAIDYSAKYIGVKIAMEGFPKAEVIINQTKNFKTKLSYYKKAYNDNLILNTFNGIQIVGFNYSNDFQTLEETLIG